MDFTKDNQTSYTLLARSAHLQVRSDLEDMGYHALSVCVSGEPGNLRYTAAYAKDGRTPPSKGFSALTRNELTTKITQLHGEGLIPYILSASDDDDGVRYAVEFRRVALQNGKVPDSLGTVVIPSMSCSEFEAENVRQRKAGKILIWADSFDDGGTRYCGIWEHRIGDRTTWIVTPDEDFDDAQEVFDAMADAWVRPDLIAFTPDDELMWMFVDSKIGKWSMITNVPVAEYEKERKDKAKAGLFPIRITAQGSGSDARITAIFANSDTVLPRKFRQSGPPARFAIDAVIKDFMQRQNLRGAALAVVKGTKLVYTQGYNYSEEAPRYPDVTPETRFRQASVSKMFCAVAIWRLIQLGKLSLNTKLIDILAPQWGDTVLSFVNPFDVEKVPKITIRHLLESRSGLRQRNSRQSVAAAKGALPCSSEELAQYMIRWFDGTPGDVDDTSYGKVDNILLGQVVRYVAKKPSFEAALKELVLDPLGMTRTRSARSLRKDQQPDEARYHLTVRNDDDEEEVFRTAESVMSDDRPVVPLQYGGDHYEIFDGSAGLSSAVVDMARLAAMLACDRDNPVLDNEHRLNMQNMGIAAHDAAKAAKVEGAHGFHGFDGPSRREDGLVMADKGGSLDGVRAYLGGTIGGFQIAFAFNGDKIPETGPGWRRLVNRAVRNAGFNATPDLFPSFGMPSLRASRPVAIRPDDSEPEDAFPNFEVRSV